MASDINRILLTARLTQDPKIFTTESGFAICTLRVASNTTRKNSATGEFEEKPNFFDVKVLGKQGENASKYLQKGSAVAVDGRLEWREFTTQDNQKRQAIEVVVDLNGSLRYLSGQKSSESSEYNSSPANHASSDDGADDDIPF